MCPNVPRAPGATGQIVYARITVRYIESDPLSVIFWISTADSFESTFRLDGHMLCRVDWAKDWEERAHSALVQKLRMLFSDFNSRRALWMGRGVMRREIVLDDILDGEWFVPIADQVSQFYDFWEELASKPHQRCK